MVTGTPYTKRRARGFVDGWPLFRNVYSKPWHWGRVIRQPGLNEPDPPGGSKSAIRQNVRETASDQVVPCSNVSP